MRKIINEIISYIDEMDYEKYYGDYTYKGKNYKASNLLLSLLISDTLKVDFVYMEDISNKHFENRIRGIALRNIHDKELHYRITKLFKELADINNKLLIMNTVTFSYHDILSDKVNFDDIMEEFESKANDNMLVSLKALADAEEKVMQRYREANSDIAKLIDSGSKGNKKNVAQEFFAIGYKVDNSSNILKKPIMSSFYNGLSSYNEAYIASVGCRNAIIQGTVSVADSGYLNRKLTFGSINIELSDTDDCGTDRYLEVDINKQNHSIVLNGRFILDEKTNKLKLINSLETQNYIGKTVKLRSPVKCRCKEGICKTCYGSFSQLNEGLSIGFIAATSLAEGATQTSLSAKHLLMAIIHFFGDKVLEYIDVRHEENKILCKKSFSIRKGIANEIIFIIDGEEIEFKNSFKNLEFDDKEKLEEYENGSVITYNEGDLIFTGIQDYVSTDINRIMKHLEMVFERLDVMKQIDDIDVYYNQLLKCVMEVSMIPSVHSEILFSQMIKVKDKLYMLHRHHPEEESEIVSIRKSNLSNSLFNNILFERVENSILNIDNLYIATHGREFTSTKYEKLFQ